MLFCWHIKIGTLQDPANIVTENYLITSITYKYYNNNEL